MEICRVRGKNCERGNFFNRGRVNSLADRVPSRRYQEKFFFFFIDGASKVIFEFCLKIDKFHFG
jgi:hypothetical protein